MSGPETNIRIEANKNKEKNDVSETKYLNRKKKIEKLEKAYEKIIEDAQQLVSLAKEVSSNRGIKTEKNLHKWAPFKIILNSFKKIKNKSTTHTHRHTHKSTTHSFIYSDIRRRNFLSNLGEKPIYSPDRRVSTTCVQKITKFTEKDRQISMLTSCIFSPITNVILPSTIPTSIPTQTELSSTYSIPSLEDILTNVSKTENYTLSGKPNTICFTVRNTNKTDILDIVTLPFDCKTLELSTDESLIKNESCSEKQTVEDDVENDEDNQEISSISECQSDALNLSTSELTLTTTTLNSNSECTTTVIKPKTNPAKPSIRVTRIIRISNGQETENGGCQILGRMLGKHRHELKRLESRIDMLFPPREIHLSKERRKLKHNGERLNNGIYNKYLKRRNLNISDNSKQVPYYFNYLNTLSDMSEPITKSLFQYINKYQKPEFKKDFEDTTYSAFNRTTTENNLHNFPTSRFIYRRNPLISNFQNLEKSFDYGDNNNYFEFRYGEPNSENLVKRKNIKSKIDKKEKDKENLGIIMSRKKMKPKNKNRRKWFYDKKNKVGGGSFGNNNNKENLKDISRWRNDKEYYYSCSTIKNGAAVNKRNKNTMNMLTRKVVCRTAATLKKVIVTNNTTKSSREAVKCIVKPTKTKYIDRKMSMCPGLNRKNRVAVTNNPKKASDSALFSTWTDQYTQSSLKCQFYSAKFESPRQKKWKTTPDPIKSPSTEQCDDEFETEFLNINRFSSLCFDFDRNFNHNSQFTMIKKDPVNAKSIVKSKLSTVETNIQETNLVGSTTKSSRDLNSVAKSLLEKIQEEIKGLNITMNRTTEGQKTEYELPPYVV